MSRYARERRTPNVRRKQRVELSEGNIVLRLLGVGVAIVIAAVAFGSVISNLLTTQTGWQVIEAANPETGIAQQFTLNYNIGASGMAATAELKAVSSVYTESLEYAYRVLSNLDMEHYVNLHTLNTHVGEELTVDALTYHAFEAFEAAGSRYPYYAPMMEQYESLFSCSDDVEAEKFDPEKSSDLAEFAAEVSAFARNSDMVQVVLQGNNTLRLDVAPEYLTYAEENGIESFVDFGFLLNAFLCDAASDALTGQGYTNGILSSFDGFSRALGTEGMGIRICDLSEGKPIQIASALSEGKTAVVNCYAFPLVPMDQERYYTYSDGTIRAPYLGEDTLLRTAADGLITADTGSVAALAIRTHAAFASEHPEEAAMSYILLQNGKLQSAGNLLHLQ